MFKVIAKQIVGRLLQALSWFFDHLEYVTHPGKISDRHIDPYICRFLGCVPDPERLYCDRCLENLDRKNHCIKCGEEI